MNNTWLEIIKGELEQAIAVSGAAIPGAKLRQRVAHAAKAQGLDFPPPDMGKFSAFVEKFPADFIVQRYPGSDILVVPANRPELLTKDAPHSKNVRMRQDLFEALTTIDTNRKGIAYYSPVTDAVVWIGEGAQPPASAVPLPQASIDRELETRRKFVDQAVKPGLAKNNLSEALAKNTPLRFFRETIRAHGLVQEWHQFRMGELTARLKEWSAEKAVTWQVKWVESMGLSASLQVPAPVPPDSRMQLAWLAGRLTNEDLARISVPLDVVLRVLGPKE